MKQYFLVITVILSIYFISCSRDEPFVAPPPPPPVVTPTINEIYSQGDSLNPDWIEIYNPSTLQMNLSGYKIYDNDGHSGSKPKMVIANGTLLPAKGFLVIVVNDTTTSGFFGLSSSGEQIWFENAAGSVIDNVTFPALGKDTSYARNPNGTANWIKIAPPTKGVSNGVSPILMNEIYSRGVPTDPDWIEIYNPNSESVDITGYKIYDVGGQSGSKPKKEFPSGTIIPANGFFVIVTDNSPDPSYFGLSSGGEAVWLDNASGNVIDNVTFPAMPDTTTSYCRIPDGSATWQISTNRTRGNSNLP